MAYKNKLTSRRGFTIVELLVVIVVIAILAAITIVSYTGISSRAISSSMQSDLSNAATILKMYYTDNSSYPASIDNNTHCTDDPRYCLKVSEGNDFYYPTITTPSNTFRLYSTRGTTQGYYITESSSSSVGGINLISDINASFEDGSIGNWWFGTGGATNSSVWFYHGTKSIKFALSSHPGDSARLNIFPLVSPGSTYTVSARLKSVAGSFARVILYDNVTGSTVGNSITVGNEGTSIVTKTISPSATGVALYINNGSWPSEIYADAIKLEIGSTASPF